MSLRIPNADKADCPVAPENYDMYDEQARWISKPVVAYRTDSERRIEPIAKDSTATRKTEKGSSALSNAFPIHTE